MKFSMFVTEEEIQVNLTPENDHEKKYLNMLMDYQGPVRLHHGVNIAESQGGYIRNYGRDSETLAITINRQEDPQIVKRET